MDHSDQNLQTAHELGKIYHSFLDKKLLCDFFIENTAALLKAQEGFLFLSAENGKIWLESKAIASEVPGKFSQADMQTFFEKGQPVRQDRCLLIPLIVRNTAVGISGFYRAAEQPVFGDPDYLLASGLSHQLAGALKNLLLFEQNLKMERLAAIGQTMGVILHEVKNIIQLATFSQEYLKMGIKKSKPESVERGMKGMERFIRQMDGFIYEMLSLTKDYKIAPEKCGLSSLFEELREDLQDKARQFNVGMEFTVEPPLEEVECEPKSLYRALLNLVKNAFEACEKENSFVHVHAKSVSPEAYQITIQDNGQGMSDETRAKLFQAFYTTKGEKGTGLGLMVIDRTVKAHHGEIVVTSEPGLGTTFTLTLPKKLPV